jgi:hypothetical protein
MKIRMLEHNITTAFERAVGVGLEGAVTAGAVNPGVEFLIDEGPLRTPTADLMSGKIRIHETHLNFLWAIFYALLVIQEEGIGIPLRKGTFTGQVRFDSTTLIEARNLFRWALSLRRSFSAWPVGLPNPETSKSTGLSATYAAKVNGLFVCATSYLLCHEYAHLISEHAQTIEALRKIPRHQLTAEDRALGKQLESEADDFARRAVQSSNDETGALVQSAIAAVMLHCADMLSFLDPMDVKQSVHPDVDQRLLNAIHFAETSSPANNFLWFTASFAARKFFDMHGLAVTEPASISSPQELFEYYLTIFDRMKTSQFL